jgi:hypothetical protein
LTRSWSPISRTGNSEVVISERVPETAPIALLGAGLVGFVAAVWRPALGHTAT